MKRAFATLILVLLIATMANAQFAFEGGYNLSNMSIKLNDTKFTTKAKKGANFGMMVDIPLEDKRHVFFQPGVFFAMAGADLTDKPRGEYSFNLTDVHLTIEYKSGTKCGPRFMMGAGPIIGYNSTGTYAIGTYGKNLPVGGDITVGDSRENILKKRGLGFGVNMGYKFKKHTYIRGGYQIGISNIRPVGNKKNSIKTSALSLNIGYVFGSCKQKGSSFGFSREKSNHWRGMSKGVYSRKPKY